MNKFTGNPLVLEASMALVIASHVEAIVQAMEHMPIVRHMHLAQLITDLEAELNVSLALIKLRAED